MRALSNIQEIIERSIEMALLEVLVANGYAVDRYYYLNDYAGYEAKLAEIKTTMGFAVELYGHGSSHDRDLKTIPRIVVTGAGFFAGDTGNAFEPSYEANGDGTYKKIQESPMFSNYRFDITLSAENSAQDRILEAVRQAALANLSFIKIYNSDTERFLIEYGFMRQSPDLITGLIEKTYSYEAKDVKEQVAEVLNGSIAKMKDITIKESGTDFIKRKSILLQVDEGAAITDNENTILN